MSDSDNNVQPNLRRVGNVGSINDRVSDTAHRILYESIRTAVDEVLDGPETEASDEIDEIAEVVSENEYQR